MHIINVTPLEPGVYNDHRSDTITTPPDGWAYIPGDFPLPSTFPRLGDLTTEEVTYTKEVKKRKEVTKTRDTGMIDDDGNPILQEYTEMETVMEPVEYTMLTVTAMTEGTLPESIEPTTEQQIAELKSQLSATDYKIIKCSEAQLVGEELPYDVTALHAERQAFRDEINKLEGGAE